MSDTLIMAPISMGELVDKITILRIKLENINDASKAENVKHELALLEDIFAKAGVDVAGFDALVESLYKVNRSLWDVEDDKRQCERDQSFGDAFIQLARRVYLENDERARIKKEINLATGSSIVEEKSYAKYGS